MTPSHKLTAAEARRQIQYGAEASARYGAYALADARSASAEYPQISFDEFYAILVRCGATGGYAKEAIRNAWNRTRGGSGSPRIDAP